MAARIPATFGGTLGLLSLFDVSQMLMLNRATGCVDIKSDGMNGALWFDEGRLVNALDDARGEGENAAYRVFSWRTGTFEFRSEPSNGSVVIEGSTDAIMLESARRMDESALAAGEEGHETERLRERQSAVEALREEFGRVAREMGTTGEVPPTAFSATRLYRLARPSDRLLFEVGRSPRVREGESWSETGEPPISAIDYESLRAGLFAVSTPIDADAGPLAPRKIELANGVTLNFEFLIDAGREMLWVRPIECPPPDLEKLGDPAAYERSLSLDCGLVLACARDADAAEGLLHAWVAAQDRKFPTVTLVAEALAVYRHERARGVVVSAAARRLAAWTPTLDPEVVVLGRGVAWESLHPLPLDRVRRWAGAAVGTDPADAACHWMASAYAANPSSHAWFGARPVVLLAAPDGREPLRAWALTDAQRTLLTDGDARGLAAALESTAVPAASVRRAA
ncbi:MAG: DUF4388 domain-containing protein [Candidatus Eisenbacteria bacterium]|uniref:DUF4388 domain-containing protein n=1 Tax=Eiseniibacteriota bacterium TaxID=2212470 RepID=A0A849SL01_UNCEI|nr:DUF4388 domain-containing protein [Candidatus Eisenbacteria bacterium]